MASSGCSLLLAFLTFGLLCSSAWAEGSGWSEINDDYLKDERVKSLLENIQAQAGSMMQQAPDNSTGLDEVEPEILEQFYALKNSTKNIDNGGSCYDGDFYAKPVTTFLGSMMPASLPDSRGVLAAYTAEIHFNLSSDLADVYRADLLLYQELTLTSPKHMPRDYQQYVEIKALLQGTEGLERHSVDGKYIDTFADGHQVFDVTKAVEQWLEHKVEGMVTLEVVVSCYSSPHCAETDAQGRGPAKVSFLYATSNSSKAPRVIVISNNPLEPTTSRISKRSANKGPKFCESTNELCCLKPLRINFKEDLGLSRVVEPVDFEANYCQGICPGVSDTEVMSDNHRYTFLSRLGMNHPALTLEPCCAGAQYDSEPVIIKTYNSNIKKYVTQIIKLQQVRVTACRCG